MAHTILAVDDSNSIRQMIRFTLEKAGYAVVEAENGEDGLQQAKSSQIDLIISDLNMPERDGISMVSEIRQLPNYKFTPILMLTTESEGERKMAGKAAGATGWIVKPFNPTQLLSVIKRVLPDAT